MFKKVWTSSQQLPAIHATRSGYLLTCRCGAKVSGLRNHQSQVARCASCQEELFVLPTSPRPVPHGWVQSVDAQVVEPKQRKTLPTPWAVAFAFILASIAIIPFATQIIYPQTNMQTTPKENGASSSIGVHDNNIIWSNGPNNEPLSSYIEKLTLAISAIDAKSNPDELQSMRKLLKQARACQAVSLISLEDLLTECVSMPETLNVSQIESINKKMFVWDTHVFKDNTSGLSIRNYRIIGSGIQAQIKLGNQIALNNLENPNSRRMIFAIRLKNIRMSVAGWHADFDDDSAVLIEDSCFLDLLGIPRDPETLEIIKAQKSSGIAVN